MNTRDLLVGSSLIAAAAASIATSQLPDRWYVSAQIEAETFALSSEQTSVVRELEVEVTPATYSAPEPTMSEAYVWFDLVGLDGGEHEQSPQVALTLYDADDGVVLDQVDATLVLGEEQIDIQLWFSPLLEACELDGECGPRVLQVEAELVRGELVYGTWGARASVEGGSEEVTEPPPGAEITLVAVEPDLED